jgi:hypothetical protein
MASIRVSLFHILFNEMKEECISIKFRVLWDLMPCSKLDFGQRLLK